MVFGLGEEDEENLEEKISDLFTDLGEKPRVTAVSRVGRRNSDGIRPAFIKCAKCGGNFGNFEKKLRAKIKNQNFDFLSHQRCSS